MLEAESDPTVDDHDPANSSSNCLGAKMETKFSREIKVSEEVRKTMGNCMYQLVADRNCSKRLSLKYDGLVKWSSLEQRLLDICRTSLSSLGCIVRSPVAFLQKQRLTFSIYLSKWFSSSFRGIPLTELAGVWLPYMAWII